VDCGGGEKESNETAAIQNTKCSKSQMFKIPKVQNPKSAKNDQNTNNKKNAQNTKSSKSQISQKRSKSQILFFQYTFI